MLMADTHMYLGNDAYNERRVERDDLLALLDRYCLAGAVIVPFCETPGPQTHGHQLIADAVAAHPGKLVGLARIDPRYGAQSISALQEAVTRLGSRGLFFDPVTVRTPPYHPGALRLLDAAAELNLPVLIPAGEGYFGLPEGIVRLAELRPQPALWLRLPILEFSG